MSKLMPKYIRFCTECPYRVVAEYNSESDYCNYGDQTFHPIEDSRILPDWCPLDDDPRGDI
jgi:hypothetical protein